MSQGLFSELLRRRVPHVLSVYVAAGWGVVEAVDWVVSRYALPGGVVDATLVSLVVLIPSVVLLAWFHGARGPDQWGLPEKIGIPLNLILVAAVFVFFIGDDVDGSSPSVVVLPFTDVSESAEHHYFAVGLSEELRHALSGVRGLYVPGSTSSNYFAGKNVELAEIGAKLGVTHVLEGTVRRRGDSLRVVAKLINIANGFTVWTDTFDRKMTDLLAIQADVARMVAGQLRGELNSDAELERLADRGTRSPEAFEIYAIAQAQLRERTLESECNAFENYKEAASLDPEFAEAWAGVAISLALMINNFGDRACVHIDLANSVSQAAVTTGMYLDPQSSQVWTAAGLIAEGLRAAGERDLARNPETTLASLEAFARAVELDPNNALALALLANAYEVGLNDRETAVDYYRRALAVDPLERRPRINLGDSLMRLGRTDEALDEYMRVVSDHPEWPVGWRYVHEYHMAVGKPDIALLVAMQAVEQFPDSIPHRFDFLRTAIGMDDFDTAYAFLEEQTDSAWADDAAMFIRAFELSDWPNLAQALSNADGPEEMGEWAFALLQAGRPDFVEQMLELVSPELLESPPEIRKEQAGAALLLAHVRTTQDKPAEAVAIVEKIRSFFNGQEVPNPRHRQRLLDAILFTLEGDNDGAIAELTAAVDAGFTEVRSGIRLLPPFPVRIDENVLLGTLHDDPRFAALAARMDEANAAARARLRSGESVSPLSHITSPTP